MMKFDYEWNDRVMTVTHREVTALEAVRIDMRSVRPDGATPTLEEKYLLALDICREYIEDIDGEKPDFTKMPAMLPIVLAAKLKRLGLFGAQPEND